jgi:hypothetical protein
MLCSPVKLLWLVPAKNFWLSREFAFVEARIWSVEFTPKDLVKGVNFEYFS